MYYFKTCCCKPGILLTGSLCGLKHSWQLSTVEYSEILICNKINMSFTFTAYFRNIHQGWRQVLRCFTNDLKRKNVFTIYFIPIWKQLKENIFFWFKLDILFQVLLEMESFHTDDDLMLKLFLILPWNKPFAACSLLRMLFYCQTLVCICCLISFAQSKVFDWWF